MNTRYMYLRKLRNNLQTQGRLRRGVRPGHAIYMGTVSMEAWPTSTSHGLQSMERGAAILSGHSLRWRRKTIHAMDFVGDRRRTRTTCRAASLDCSEWSEERDVRTHGWTGSRAETHGGPGREPDDDPSSWLVTQQPDHGQPTTATELSHTDSFSPV